MLKRLKSKTGKENYALRMHTVEPVFGSLQQYYGLRWMNTRGIKNATKVMLMAASAFNLKKWIKATIKSEKSPLLCVFFTSIIANYYRTICSLFKINSNTSINRNLNNSNNQENLYFYGV